VIGRRVYDKESYELAEGEYCKGEDGHWYAHCPGEGRLLANLAGHTITEHDDGTISVHPSIRCSSGSIGHSYHGHLEHGVWRLHNE